MKDKVKITEDNYREVVLKRSIILCWVLLAICFVIKIFGGNFFAIVCTNEKFIKVCEFVDNSIIKYIIYFMLYIFTMINLLKITDGKFIIIQRKTLVYLVLMLIIWAFKIFIQFYPINNIIANVIILASSYLILLIFTKKKLFSILTLLYDLIFSLVSALIKNIGLGNILTNSFLMTTIFSIDYYILLLITAMYSTLKCKRRLE